MTKNTDLPPLDYDLIWTNKDAEIEALKQRLDAIEDEQEDTKEELQATLEQLEVERNNNKTLGKELWNVRCILAKRMGEIDMLKMQLADATKNIGKIKKRAQKRLKTVTPTTSDIALGSIQNSKKMKIERK